MWFLWNRVLSNPERRGQAEQVGSDWFCPQIISETEDGLCYVLRWLLLLHTIYTGSGV